MTSLVPLLAGSANGGRLSGNVVRSLVAQSSGQQAVAMVVTVVHWALNPPLAAENKHEARPVSNSWDGGRPNDVRVDDEGISVPVEEEIYRARGYQPPVDELPWEDDYLRQYASTKSYNQSYFSVMTDDADFRPFKPVIEQWRVEYGRIRKLGGGDYWAGCRLEEAATRSKMSPYALGLADHRSMREAVERGDKQKPFPCPFDDGTPEKAEYDRGWDALPPRP